MNERSDSIQRRLATQMLITDEELHARFAGLTAGQGGRSADLVVAFLDLAKKVRELTPASREQQLVWTKLEEAQTWAELAISRNPAGAATPKPY